jgi:integrase
MPYEDVAAFVSQLREREATAALALEFCILTAARSGEVLGARWSEMDLDKKIWTVPANRMKAGREHRVPLSGRAVSILKQLSKLKSGDFVFPGQARSKPLSNMAMEMMLRRMKIEDATVHGFRSSFRDWAGNVSNFPREVIETALAHVIGDKAEQAWGEIASGTISADMSGQDEGWLPTIGTWNDSMDMKRPWTTGALP